MGKEKASTPPDARAVRTRNSGPMEKELSGAGTPLHGRRARSSEGAAHHRPALQKLDQNPVLAAHAKKKAAPERCPEGGSCFPYAGKMAPPIEPAAHPPRLPECERARPLKDYAGRNRFSKRNTGPGTALTSTARTTGLAFGQAGERTRTKVWTSGLKRRGGPCGPPRRLALPGA